MTAPRYAAVLLDAVDRASGHLRGMPETEASKPLAPGKWSAKEVIGHLVDSASNNHGRFVRASLGAGLRFDGYEQDGWVEAQTYQDAPWPELVDLWAAFNRHIARVMTVVPEEVRRRGTLDHDLDRLAWEKVPAGEPASLEYLMHDYVGHLLHHLNQIRPGLAPRPTLQRGTR